MNKMDERIEELFPFYALEAVTDEERAEVEAYIQVDPAARARLEETMAAADNLAFLAEPMTPSTPVREQVLAYARRRPHLPSTPAVSPTPLPWWQRLRPAPALAGLATIAAILLFIWVLTLQRTIANLESQVTALRPLEATVAELQNQVQTLQEALAQRDDILAILPEGRGLPIAGTEVQPNATGQLVVGADGQSAVLFVTDMQALPAGQTYQLWLIGDNGPESEGLFTVNAEGVGILEVAAETAVFNYAAIGVSVEPEGGSPQPTGDIVMLGEIIPPDTDS